MCSLVPVILPGTRCQGGSQPHPPGRPPIFSQCGDLLSPSLGTALGTTSSLRPIASCRWAIGSYLSASSAHAWAPGGVDVAPEPPAGRQWREGSALPTCLCALRGRPVGPSIEGCCGAPGTAGLSLLRAEAGFSLRGVWGRVTLPR